MTDLTRLPNQIGLHEEWTSERPYFERAYQAPGGEIIRVRFQPVTTDTGMTANIPLMPRMVAMMASASEIGEDGQVLIINGRGLVRPAMSFVQGSMEGGFNADEFVKTAASKLAEELLSFKRQMQDAALLIPPPQTPADASQN